MKHSKKVNRRRGYLAGIDTVDKLLSQDSISAILTETEGDRGDIEDLLILTVNKDRIVTIRTTMQEDDLLAALIKAQNIILNGDTGDDCGCT